MRPTNPTAPSPSLLLPTPAAPTQTACHIPDPGEQNTGGKPKAMTFLKLKVKLPKQTSFVFLYFSMFKKQESESEEDIVLTVGLPTVPAGVPSVCLPAAGVW